MEGITNYSSDEEVKEIHKTTISSSSDSEDSKAVMGNSELNDLTKEDDAKAHAAQQKKLADEWDSFECMLGEGAFVSKPDKPSADGDQNNVVDLTEDVSRRRTISSSSSDSSHHSVTIAKRSRSDSSSSSNSSHSARSKDGKAPTIDIEKDLPKKAERRRSSCSSVDTPSPARKHKRRRSRSHSRSRSRSKHRKSHRSSRRSRSRDRRSRSRGHKSSSRRRSSRDRKGSRRDRHRRSRSRNRRSRSRNRRSRSRHRRSRDRRSRSRDRRHKRRHRSRSNSRGRYRRSLSRDRYRRRRGHSKSPRDHSRSPDRRSPKKTFKEAMRAKILGVAKEMDHGSGSNETINREKPSNLPLNPTMIPTNLQNLANNPQAIQAMQAAAVADAIKDGKMTPQLALLQTMAVMQQKAQELTGVQVPKYYNPTAINPMKYAEQMQKRKLLWSKAQDNKEEKQLAWGGTHFDGDKGEKTTEKFRKLMGIKEDLVEKVNQNSEKVQEINNEAHRKQDALFQHLDKEYEMARMTTHTQRGVGFGFSTQQQHQQAQLQAILFNQNQNTPGTSK